MPQSKENVHAGHRNRLRQRFMDEGLESFRPHEVLELLLFYTIPRKDTNVLAHRLLDHFHNSFPAVLEASAAELMEVDGVSVASACFIKLLFACQRYYYLERTRSITQLNTLNKKFEYVKGLFHNCSMERVYCICLSPAKKIIRTVLLGEGSRDAVSGTAAKAVSLVAATGASSVLLAHNHPDGIPVFSTDDYEYTIYLKKALDAIDVSLEDHILVADDECCSLMAMGNGEQLLKIYEMNKM